MEKPTFPEIRVAQYDFGMIGLGVMGRNLALNIADRGYSVVGFDKDQDKTQALTQESRQRNILSVRDLRAFVSTLKTPRAILLLVPAGAAVDAVIEELMPLLSAGDLLADCGNSHFSDTDRRAGRLEEAGLRFLGVGVSGGEAGARFGPSIMPGGDREAFERIAPMLQAISAKVNGEPCMGWLGPRSAGHYVKMAHNGIEYALMQLLAETYHMLKEAGGLDNDELHALFSRWNQGPLQSFLLEITAAIFARADDLSPARLIDRIKASAKQKGTGMWTSQNAFDLHVPVPAIDMAVAQRDLSALAEERHIAHTLHTLHLSGDPVDKPPLPAQLEQALQFAAIVTYAQGLSLLHHASQAYGYGLQLAEVARVWRGGCIIRAALLEDIRAVYANEPGLPSLLLAPVLAQKLTALQAGARSVLKTAIDRGIPVPAFMACLSYYDAYRRDWLPANLIQAQRDFFGAHTYERTDRAGVFHTNWGQ